MIYRKYNFTCTDPNGNYLFDMPMNVPVYSVEEYNSFISEYNKYEDHTVIYGKDSPGNPGDVTEYGSFVLNNMGLKYAGFPYTVPVDKDYNKKWQALILKQFTSLYDISSNISKVPISKSDDTFAYRDFNIINENGISVKASFWNYIKDRDKYRPQYLDTYKPNESSYDYRFPSFGSGYIGNSDSNMLASIYLIYIVEDNTCGRISGYGYYEETPKNLIFRISTSTKVADGSIYNLLVNSTYEENDPSDTDPYKNGGNTSKGGGTGNFNGKSEAIDFPNLPTLSAVDTGLISLFNPTATEVKNLADYLWGDLFDVSTWKKIIANPMDAILGLSIVPVNVPSSGSSPITIGNISTGISMTKASSQYVSVDCGTINVNEYWGAYLDYSPYTEAEIYLPFVGIHPLKIDDIMGKPVHVVYHVDVLSGACCSYVKCGNSVLYSFVGQCSCSIPITANDWTNVINGAISMGTAIGSMVATGGASAPMAVPGMASTAVNSIKPSVEKSGAMGGMGGMLGVQKPYIILTRPKQALPHKQNTFTGYPSFITKRLRDCYGYTEVESIHLENVHATDGELKEINDLLKSGVIF